MFNIIYEDDYCLAVNKPSGVSVIPAKNNRRLSLVELLNKKLKESNVAYRLHPCHRIDQDASGIVLFAKGKAIQTKIMEQFRQRVVKKKYIAFVRGKLEPKNSKLVSNIKAIRKDYKRAAILEYHCLAQTKDWSVVQVEPLTGWKHQIRIQFANINHPLLGERLYAFGRDFKVNFKRLALHAKEIIFSHPKNSQTICLSIDLPEDMKKFLESYGLSSKL
jgi:23S rRNA pseudouridine1911/1915/1917 synthase